MEPVDTKQSKCIWRKTKAGNWAIMGPASVVKKGATVSVAKKSGEISLETIEKIGVPFEVEGIPFVYGYPVKEAYECIECGEPLHTAAQKRSGYCRPDCG